MALFLLVPLRRIEQIVSNENYITIVCLINSFTFDSYIAYLQKTVWFSMDLIQIVLLFSLQILKVPTLDISYWFRSKYKAFKIMFFFGRTKYLQAKTYREIRQWFAVGFKWKQTLKQTKQRALQKISNYTGLQTKFSLLLCMIHVRKFLCNALFLIKRYFCLKIMIKHQ